MNQTRGSEGLVHEEAEDAVPVGRAVCAGVEVHQIVGGARLQLPSRRLQRPEGAGARPAVLHERGHGPGEKGDQVAQVPAQDEVDLFPFLPGGIDADGAIGEEVVAHVLSSECAFEPAQ
ncbi:MAG TPA: hypothetical protein VFG53_17270 [Anaeromyxobacter sp.]|nr:hypothetical protein [Anaeromyxobacter sp.]